MSDVKVWRVFHAARYDEREEGGFIKGKCVEEYDGSFMSWGHPHMVAVEDYDALRAEVERLTADNARKDDEIMALHQIGSMDDLREIASECAQRDYCSCAPCEMSYCVTQRFVAELQRKLDAAGSAGEGQRG